VISALAMINASIVQGSAIGPASFVVAASDLKAQSMNNSLEKYANDAFLIVPADNVDSRLAEISHIEGWGKMNNLKLNLNKTVEIVFTGPRRGRKLPFTPPYIDPRGQLSHVTKDAGGYIAKQSINE